MKQYLRGTESPLAQFDDRNDAIAFIKEIKMVQDASLKIPVIYRIYHAHELLDEFDPSKMDATSGQSQSSQGAGSSASARPTPFATAPRPSGMPPKWSTNKKDDEEKK